MSGFMQKSEKNPQKSSTFKRLSYLIGLTIFSTTTIFVIIMTISVTSPITPAKVVIILIFSGITYMFYRLYKKQANLSKQKIEELEQLKKEIEQTRQASFDPTAFGLYEAEINKALHEKHHIHPELTIDQITEKISEIGKGVIPLTSTEERQKYFEQNKPAEQYASDILKKIKEKGYDGAPEIFTKRYSDANLPRFYKLNKAFFGGYNPTQKQIFGLTGMYAVIALFFYAMPQIFLGINEHPFIPSEIWHIQANTIAQLSTLALSILMYKKSAEQNHENIKKIGGRIGKYILFPAIPLFLYFFIFVSVQQGLGGVLNSLSGTNQDRIVEVQKDMDTKKGRHNNITAYCLKLRDYNTSFWDNDYCIKKEHYNALAPDSIYRIRFKTTQSYFGTTLNGYYFPDKLESRKEFWERMQRKI